MALCAQALRQQPWPSLLYFRYLDALAFQQTLLALPIDWTAQEAALGALYHAGNSEALVMLECIRTWEYTHAI